MLAVLGGVLALLLGLTVLLLPVLATELSRPRDSVWGAVVLLLGLVLVTSSDRLTGAPMLGVLCGGLLIGRLGLEVGQGRWRQLSPEEQQRLWSQERWQTSLQELAATLARLVAVSGGAVSGLGRWIAERRRPRTSSKRWVRQDMPDPHPDHPAEAQQPPTEEEPRLEVTSLDGVDQLLRNAPEPAAPPDPSEAEAPEDPSPPRAEAG
ncbi:MULTISPECIES: Ycf66 family protein [Aphanothece]|uniref:Ycf66 family protein n=1 Tax=Aphanothece TaxID=1121 RepID=UPI003985092B